MKFIKNLNGLTLIEVVVASLLLVSTLAPIFTLMHSCLGNFNSAGTKSQNIFAGKSVMEEVIASKDFTVKQLQGVTYQEDSSVKYDLTINSYNGSMHLRSIEVLVYEEEFPEKKISLYTVRVIQ